jgi:uncharacterized OB-fold protein
MTYMPSNGAMPREFRPFFEGLAKKHISFPRCTACGKFHWYPMYSCPFCGNGAIEWNEIDGCGTLYSWTTVHHAFSADPPRTLPYIVGLVVFADAPGVRLITNIVGARSERLFENMQLVPIISLSPQPTVTFKPLQAESDAGRASEP